MAQTSPAHAAAIDPNGWLKVATTLEPLGPLHFDPATSNVNADVTWEEMIFGTLLRWNAKGGLDPWMAESYKVVDPADGHDDAAEGAHLHRRHAL